MNLCESFGVFFTKQKWSDNKASAVTIEFLCIEPVKSQQGAAARLPVGAAWALHR